MLSYLAAYTGLSMQRTFAGERQLLQDNDERFDKENIMSDNPEVRLETLAPVKVVVGRGYGKEPEGPAWEAALKTLAELGLAEKLVELTCYGFNNPDPSPGNENYGYEQWIVLPEDVTPGVESVETLDYAGGLYAVMEMPVPGPQHLFAHWQKLAAWREDSPYLFDRSRPYLEHLLNPESVPAGKFDEMRFRLYLPVMEP